MNNELTPVEVCQVCDWRKLENAVTERIRALAVISQGLNKDSQDAQLIAGDLIIPAMRLLQEFHDCVELHGQAPDHKGN